MDLVVRGPLPVSGYAGDVPLLFGIQSLTLLVVTLAMLALHAWAFVDALTHRPDAYVAADKQTKQLWLILLGIALAAHILLLNNPFHILNLIAAVAAIVYLVDVRPALRTVTGRR